MKAEQYRPSFCDGPELKQVHFANTKELLKIDWIKTWADDKNFHRFSISRDTSGILEVPQHTLMAEFKEGLEWWVISCIRDKDINGIDNLPEWEAKYKKEE